MMHRIKSERKKKITCNFKTINTFSIRHF